MRSNRLNWRKQIKVLKKHQKNMRKHEKILENIWKHKKTNKNKNTDYAWENVIKLLQLIIFIQTMQFLILWEIGIWKLVTKLLGNTF